MFILCVSVLLSDDDEGGHYNPALDVEGEREGERGSTKM